MEYTTIGDTTNTAARLEALTKGTDFQLYLSEQTKVALHEAQEDLVFVESLAIRGREQGVNVWGLVESKQDGPPADIFESVS